MTDAQLSELHTIIGRLNGLHTFCLALARSLPTATAEVVATNLQAALQRVEADAVASPIPENHLNELVRVLEQFDNVLRHCAEGP